MLFQYTPTERAVHSPPAVQHPTVSAMSSRSATRRRKVRRKYRTRRPSIAEPKAGVEEEEEGNAHNTEQPSVAQLAEEMNGTDAGAKEEGGGEGEEETKGATGSEDADVDMKHTAAETEPSAAKRKREADAEERPIAHTDGAPTPPKKPRRLHIVSANGRVRVVVPATRSSAHGHGSPTLLVAPTNVSVADVLQRADDDAEECMCTFMRDVAFVFVFMPNASVSMPATESVVRTFLQSGDTMPRSDDLLAHIYNIFSAVRSKVELEKQAGRAFGLLCARMLMPFGAERAHAIDASRGRGWFQRVSSWYAEELEPFRKPRASTAPVRNGGTWARSHYVARADQWKDTIFPGIVDIANAIRGLHDVVAVRHGGTKNMPWMSKVVYDSTPTIAARAVVFLSHACRMFYPLFPTHTTTKALIKYA